jgi:NitT/TauT family transport system substrate-binding protein
MKSTKPGQRLLAKVTYVVVGLMTMSAGTLSAQGIVSHGALQRPEYAAAEFGWFKENRVEVDMIVVGGGAAQQLAAGALNIAQREFLEDLRNRPRSRVCVVADAVAVEPFSASKFPDRRESAGNFCQLQGISPETRRKEPSD